jgi:hypothetical protein
MFGRAIVLGLCIAVLASGGSPAARAAASVPTTPQQLHKVMVATLAAVPRYFAPLRGPVKSTGEGEILFTLSASFAKLCPGCAVTDEYATAQNNERFAVTGNWPVPPAWTNAQKIAYIQTNIAPLVKGYAYTHGKTSDGQLWFEWLKGSPATFVYLETYRNKSYNGIQIRVGHYVPVNINYVKWARLTADQRTDLSSGVERLVTAGTNYGAQNFAPLRGAATDKDNNYFHVNQTFGSVLTDCDVDGIFADEGSSGGTGKWILECQTPYVGGTKADILELIRSAIASALPSGFVPTTDPKYLGTADYRWDRSSDLTEVELSTSDPLSDGTITYYIRIYHFTT